MVSINQKKRKNIAVIFMICIVIVLVIGGCLYYFLKERRVADSSLNAPNLNNVQTTDTKPVVNGGTLTGKPSEEESYIDSMSFDNREYYVDYIRFNDKTSISDKRYDIRIHFPDGEDFVVVPAKIITDRTEEGLYIMFNEHEMHMLSSARTDTEVYEGAYLYMASYESINVKKSEEDYPWNQFVMSSYGITEVNSEEIYNRRIQLEENLVSFMDKTLQK